MCWELRPGRFMIFLLNRQICSPCLWSFHQHSKRSWDGELAGALHRQEGLKQGPKFTDPPGKFICPWGKQNERIDSRWNGCTVFFPPRELSRACLFSVERWAELGLGLCMYVCAQSCPTLWYPWTVAWGWLLCPWDSPGKNTGVGCRFLLQGIFPTQGSNLPLLHWQVDSLPVCQLGGIRVRRLTWILCLSNLILLGPSMPFLVKSSFRKNFSKSVWWEPYTPDAWSPLISDQVPHHQPNPAGDVFSLYPEQKILSG